MGMLMEYFAATGEELAAMDLGLGPACNDLPYVDCRGWVLEVEEFVAEIDGRDVSEFGPDEPLVDGVDTIDAERLGPWTVRANDAFVASLVRLQEEQIQAYGDRFLLEDWEVDRLVALACLAQEAREEGRDIYSWWSL
ncbi:hypothetical protein AB0K00_36400 [Dactylosporangium sp. NPDC049525]|uniref:hypothetical protein n=1 Tax=Dactylosporangium sp. NPDC049525 TaxID=3154730 RepID=UPI00341E701F